jgi:hypothetical protein
MAGTLLCGPSPNAVPFAADRSKATHQKGVKKISRKNQGHLKITRSTRTDKGSVAEAAPGQGEPDERGLPWLQTNENHTNAPLTIPPIGIKHVIAAADRLRASGWSRTVEYAPVHTNMGSSARFSIPDSAQCLPRAERCWQHHVNGTYSVHRWNNEIQDRRVILAGAGGIRPGRWRAVQVTV